jgi:hypothetical protein
MMKIDRGGGGGVKQHSVTRVEYSLKGCWCIAQSRNFQQLPTSLDEIKFYHYITFIQLL